MLDRVGERLVGLQGLEGAKGKVRAREEVDGCEGVLVSVGWGSRISANHVTLPVSGDGNCCHWVTEPSR